MARILFSVAASFLCGLTAVACTITALPFCATFHEPYDSIDLIVFAEIVAVDTQGADLEVIEVLSGQETRTRIRVWDGTDFDCNGLWSLAVETLGSVGDSILVMLPKIDTLQNTWDIIGDYRNPNHHFRTPSARIRNGMTVGYFYYGPGSISYQRAKQFILNEQSCTTLSSHEQGLDADAITIANPIGVTLTLTHDNAFAGKPYSIDLYSHPGIRHSLASKITANHVELPTDDLLPGFYLIVLHTDDKRYMRKLIKS